MPLPLSAFSNAPVSNIVTQRDQYPCVKLLYQALFGPYIRYGACLATSARFRQLSHGKVCYSFFLDHFNAVFYEQLLFISTLLLIAVLPPHVLNHFTSNSKYCFHSSPGTTAGRSSSTAPATIFSMCLDVNIPFFIWICTVRIIHNKPVDFHILFHAILGNLICNRHPQ